MLAQRTILTTSSSAFLFMVHARFPPSFHTQSLPPLFSHPSTRLHPFVPDPHTAIHKSTSFQPTPSPTDAPKCFPWQLHHPVSQHPAARRHITFLQIQWLQQQLNCPSSALYELYHIIIAALVVMSSLKIHLCPFGQKTL